MKNKKIFSLVVIVLVTMMILIACEEGVIPTSFPEKNLIIHYIDVGQGDSTLAVFPNNELALIDAGTRGGREDLVKYLKSFNVKKIDYLIGTHPHEDHIGGLAEVIRNFEIGKVYLPNKINNTQIFEELLNEIKNKGLKISEGKAGVKIIDSGELKFYIISPSKEYTNTNNNSIVTKIIYKDFSTLITGDAEKEAESDMIEEGYNLKADILRVGHHGSNTSSTGPFLDKVDPAYAIISLGKDNSYGHPDNEIIDSLEERNIVTLRTDEEGSIVIQTDGKQVKWLTDIAGNRITDEKKEQEVQGETYIGNLNSKTFHAEDCNSLPNKENQIIFNSKEEAIKEGYKAHSVCNK